jgi:WD40 repeat protein
MDKTTRVCPACNTALPPGCVEGLCPKCLLEAAVAPNEHSNASDTVSLDGSVPATPFTGTRLRYFGDYELVEEIARGGMGIVFKALQMNLNRLVALKLIHAGALASADMIKRFKGEAEAAAALNHPNIVPIFEIGEVQGQHYFSMGLVDGSNLDQYMASKPLPARQGAQLVLDLARAVHHAHQHGVLHRDIKPSNILIDRRGTAYLTDFGLAKFAAKDSTLTHTNAILGTPSYMAPEQARGDARTVTTVADVYGLGAVLYTALSGHPPFAGGTTFDTIRQVMEEDPRPPSAWNPAVEGDLETICLKCLAKEGAQRYTSAEALAVDLTHWLNSEPIEARPATRFERLRKWVRRRPAIAALSAMCAVLLAVSSVGGAFYSIRLRAAGRSMEEQLYATEMGVAFAALSRGNATQARELLDINRPGNRQKRDLRGFEWYYLQALCKPQELFTFPREEQIFGLACSPDGRLVAAGHIDRTIRLVDIVSRRDVAHLPAVGTSYSVAFDPAGKRLLYTATSGKSLHVWDLENNLPITNLLHSLDLLSTAFSPDGRLIVSSAQRALYSTNEPGELFLWSGTTYEKVAELTNHNATAWETVFSPDGRDLATAHADGTIMLWDVKQRRLIRRVPAHANIVSALAYSPDGRWLASGSLDESVSLWSLPDFRQVLLGPHERVDCVAFSKDGRWLASSARNGTIKLWDIATRTNKPLVLMGHVDRIWSMDFTPDGHRLVSGSTDGTIKLWDWQALVQQPQGPVDTALGVFFSPDGHLNLNESGSETVVRSVPSESIITNLPIKDARFSPDGRFIAGLAESRLTLLDAKTFQPLQTVTSDYPLSGPVQFSPGGEWLLVTRTNNVVELRRPHRQWSIEVLWQLSSSSNAFLGFSFSNDGRYLAAMCSDRSAAVFDLKQKRVTRELRRPDFFPSWVAPLAWIPGSYVLAVGSSLDSVVYLWNIRTGAFDDVLKPRAGNPLALAVSPNGRTLAVATQDGFISLINVRTFRIMATLRGHLTNISKLSFSPDGKMLISYGGEGSRLWSARDVQ